MVNYIKILKKLTVKNYTNNLVQVVVAVNQ